MIRLIQNNGAATRAITPDELLRSSAWLQQPELIAQDLSEEHAWQLSQEFRLQSKFFWSGKLQPRRELSALQKPKKSTTSLSIRSPSLPCATIPINLMCLA